MTEPQLQRGQAHCQGCGHVVDRTARACPSCGRHRPAGGLANEGIKFVTGVLGLMVALFVIAFLWRLFVG